VQHRITLNGELCVECFDTRVWAARDPNDPENLDYPSRKDVEKIRQKYPNVPADIFPSR
jgi:hypothetical protein